MTSQRDFPLAALLVVAGAGVTGCQTYDFEPVEPLAVAQTTKVFNVVSRKLKPDLMLLVDKSGSMAFPTTAADPACPANCGATASCPPACKTRWSEMSGAMETFLSSAGGWARMGLVAYPMIADVCQAPSLADIASNGVELNQSATDATAELQATAAAILAKLKATTPKRPWSGVVKNRRKDGDHYWVRAYASPLADGTGHVSVRVAASRQEANAAEQLYAQMRTDKKIKLDEGALVSGNVLAKLVMRLSGIGFVTRLWLMTGGAMAGFMLAVADRRFGLEHLPLEWLYF